MNDQPPPAKPRRGCLFYGCITCLVLMLLLLGAGLFAVHQYRKFVITWTDAAPMTLPTLQMSQPEIDAVRTRFDAFQKGLKEGQSVGPLELTGNDINALLESDAKMKSWRQRVFVTIEGDQIKGQVSIPLKDTPFPLVKDRYLNGSAGLKVFLQNGFLNVYLASLVVKGKPVPDTGLQQLRNENLAKGFNNDTNAMKSFERVKSIEVKDGRLIVIPKEKPQAP